MFNFSGSEIVFLLLLALIVLGPEKLPEAVRKFGKTYGEIKKMTSGFQSELKTALDEPMREMRETADAFKKAASFDFDAEAEPAKPPTDHTSSDASAGAAPPIHDVPAIQDLPVADHNVMAAATPVASTHDQPTEPTEPEPTELEPADVPPLAPTGLDALVVRDAPVQQAKPQRVTPPRPESVPESPPIAAPMTRRTPSKKSAASFRRAPKPDVRPAQETDVSGSAPPLAPRAPVVDEQRSASE